MNPFRAADEALIDRVLQPIADRAQRKDGRTCFDLSRSCIPAYVVLTSAIVGTRVALEGFGLREAVGLAFIPFVAFLIWASSHASEKASRGGTMANPMRHDRRWVRYMLLFFFVCDITNVIAGAWVWATGDENAPLMLARYVFGLGNGMSWLAAESFMACSPRPPAWNTAKQEAPGALPSEGGA